MPRQTDDGTTVPTINFTASEKALRALREVEDPGDALQTIASLRTRLPALESDLVDTMRREGASWADVGNALGTTKEAAWQRFANSPNSGS